MPTEKMRATSEMSVSTSRPELKLPSSFKGKYVGVFIFVVFQVFVGAIHIIFGPALLAASSEFVVYGVYTLLYGIIVAASAYGLYMGKLWGLDWRSCNLDNSDTSRRLHCS